MRTEDGAQERVAGDHHRLCGRHRAEGGDRPVERVHRERARAGLRRRRRRRRRSASAFASRAACAPHELRAAHRHREARHRPPRGAAAARSGRQLELVVDARAARARHAAHHLVRAAALRLLHRERRAGGHHARAPDAGAAVADALAAVGAPLADEPHRSRAESPHESDVDELQLRHVALFRAHAAAPALRYQLRDNAIAVQLLQSEQQPHKQQQQQQHVLQFAECRFLHLLCHSERGSCERLGLHLSGRGGASGPPLHREARESAAEHQYDRSVRLRPPQPAAPAAAAPAADEQQLAVLVARAPLLGLRVHAAARRTTRRRRRQLRQLRQLVQLRELQRFLFLVRVRVRVRVEHLRPHESRALRRCTTSCERLVCSSEPELRGAAAFLHEIRAHSSAQRPDFRSSFQVPRFF